MKLKHLVLLSLVLSCSVKNKDLGNQTMNGHEELYSRPDAPDSPSKNLKRIVIAATNDVHAHYGPVALRFKDKHQKSDQQIEVGGVDYFSAYVKILRDVYSHVLLLDSGDLFPSQAKDLKAAKDFYSLLKYDAVTVGLSDFNLELPAGTTSSTNLIKEFSKNSDVPILLSNLYELKTARAVEWPGTKPYVLKEVNGIKIGILGIVPNDIVSLTPMDNRVGLYVENMLQNTLWHARQLRSMGAQLIVVLTHQGVECGSAIARGQKLPLSKVNFEPEKNVCDMTGIMGEYLTRLPPHLVDVVIGGRHHQKMANIHNETVLLSGFEDGKSLSYAEFFFDAKSGKLMKEETIVRQPVVICREFFKETEDCYTEDPSVDHKEKMPASFLGKLVAPDQTLRDKFRQFFEPRKSMGFHNLPVSEILQRFEADLIFLPETKGTSQLVTIEMNGKELSQLLEERYNSGDKNDFLPNPYENKGHELHLRINEQALENEKSYRLLCDLESLQQDLSLKRTIKEMSTRSLVHHSWQSLEQKDELSTAMASTQRQ